MSMNLYLSTNIGYNGSLVNPKISWLNDISVLQLTRGKKSGPFVETFFSGRSCRRLPDATTRRRRRRRRNSCRRQRAGANVIKIIPSVIYEFSL